MKKILIPLLMLAVLASCNRPCSNALENVDTKIGGVGVLLQPTRPTVQLPNQLIRWSPARADLLDDRVWDYPLTLTTHRLQSVFGFLPILKEEGGRPWRSAWQIYDGEVTTPYEYKSCLEGCDIRFAASKKSGIIQIKFEGPGQLRFHSLQGRGSFELKDGVLRGTEPFAGMTAFTSVVFSCPVTVADSTPDGKYILLDVPEKEVTIRYGISYIDCDQALANLQQEIPTDNYEKVRDEARSVWEKTLGRIAVKGGTDAQRRLFYTSFWRCCERMVDISEYGRYYSAFDHKVHESDKPFYVDNWLWDTYVALEPLQTILDPAKEEDKLNSYVEMYKQGGTMPSFAVVWGDWPAMTGNFAAVWMADSRAKGLNFDVETAYEGIRANSLDATLLPWRNGPKCELDDFYNEHGWYPALHPGEQETVEAVSMPWERRQAVSLSTVFSYADWATAQIARELGKEDDVALFLDRAKYYRNVYRPDKKMLWPRDKEGNWIEGVDPRYMDRAYYTENNAYTFQWDVKHDLEGLFDLMGGRAAAEKNLDDLFRIQLDMAKFDFFKILPDATGMVGQFAMGNEPSFHIPYIYNYLGAPYKTQKRIHQLIDCLFSDTVSGIPGDEDGGGMSAFVVFSMMGFFPVTPGVPVYVIGSPFFEETSITLPSGKKFTVRARGYSAENKYIRSAKLNGKSLDRSWFTHEELMAGGVLELTMSPKPDKAWGSDNLPPSSVDWKR